MRIGSPCEKCGLSQVQRESMCPKTKAECSYGRSEGEGMSDLGVIFMQQGWQCPVCRRVYSPTTIMCLYCQPAKAVTTDSTATCPACGSDHAISGECNKTRVTA